MKNKTLRFSIVSIGFTSLLLMSSSCSKHNVAPAAPEDVPAAATDEVPQGSQPQQDSLNLPALPEADAAAAAPIVTGDAPVATADTGAPAGDTPAMAPIADDVPSTPDQTAPVHKKHRSHRSSASVEASATNTDQTQTAAAAPELHAEAPVAVAPAAVTPPPVAAAAPVAITPPPAAVVPPPAPVAQAVPPPAPPQQRSFAPREPAQQKTDVIEAEQPIYTKPGFLSVAALIIAAAVGAIIMGRKKSNQS